MSEEILAKESEEGTEQEDSSDIQESETVNVSLDEILEYAYDQGIEADKVDEWIAENFIVEEDDEEEEDEEEVEESSKASVKKEEGEEEEPEEEPEEEGDEEEPVGEMKMSPKAKAAAAKYRKSSAGKKAIAKSKKKRSKPGYKVDKSRAKAMAKSRAKGGISDEFKVPATKNQMLKNIYDQVNGMLKSDLSAQYEKIMASTSLEEIQEDEEVKEEVRTPAVSPEEIAPIDVEDDMKALVAGEEGLSEEFKKKASTIFEAAVHAKVVEEVNTRMEEQAKEQEAGSQEFQKELTEKVDGYLTYVVEEWMKENELAIERGIRSELVEDFMSGLKTLFAEHYIDIPEEKVDMVDDLFTKVEQLEGSLDEEINRGVELQKELAQFKKEDALKEATKDLADTDSEKISKLAEGIEFENSEQYIEKLNVLKESYFPKTDSVTSEITETDETIELTEEKSEVQADDSMSHYTSAIRRLN
jgi:hypothetical protein